MMVGVSRTEWRSSELILNPAQFPPPTGVRLFVCLLVNLISSVDLHGCEPLRHNTEQHFTSFKMIKYNWLTEQHVIKWPVAFVLYLTANAIKRLLSDKITCLELILFEVYH